MSDYDHVKPMAGFCREPISRRTNQTSANPDFPNFQPSRSTSYSSIATPSTLFLPLPNRVPPWSQTLLVPVTSSRQQLTRFRRGAATSHLPHNVSSLHRSRCPSQPGRHPCRPNCLPERPAVPRCLRPCHLQPYPRWHREALGGHAPSGAGRAVDAAP